MPRFAQNPQTGEVILYDEGIGDWRPASQAEQSVAGAGLAGQGEAFVEGMTGAQSLAGLVSPAIGERAAALGTVNPGSVTAGMVGVGLGAVGPMAGRVLARNAAKSGAKGAARAGGLKTEQGFIRQPETLLPEAAQGAGQIVRAGAETLPISRMVTDFLIKNPNQKNLNRLFMRGVGATDEQIKMAGGKVTDDLMAAADANVAEQFREVGKRITPVIDPDAVAKKALQLNEDNLISNARLLRVANEADEAGESIMALRSELLAQHRAERDAARKLMIENRIDEIDTLVKESLGDDKITQKLWSDARARYKLSLAAEKGQVWTQQNINAKSLDSALRNLYGRGYRRNADYSNMPEDVVNALKGAREAQGVSTGVPSSGTAERLFAGSMLGGALGVNL